MLKLQSVCVLTFASLLFVFTVGAGSQSRSTVDAAPDGTEVASAYTAIEFEDIAAHRPLATPEPQPAPVESTPEPAPVSEAPVALALAAPAPPPAPPPRPREVVTVVATRYVPPPAAGTLSVQAFFDAAAAAGLPATQYLLSIAMCESGLNAGATGRAGERGIMQIHPTHAHSGLISRLGYTWDQMYEPGPNLAVAAVLYRAGGFAPWSCA